MKSICSYTHLSGIEGFHLNWHKILVKVEEVNCLCNSSFFPSRVMITNHHILRHNSGMVVFERVYFMKEESGPYFCTSQKVIKGSSEMDG